MADRPRAQFCCGMGIPSWNTTPAPVLRAPAHANRILLPTAHSVYGVASCATRTFFAGYGDDWNSDDDFDGLTLLDELISGFAPDDPDKSGFQHENAGFVYVCDMR